MPLWSPINSAWWDNPTTTSATTTATSVLVSISSGTGSWTVTQGGTAYLTVSTSASLYEQSHAQYPYANQMARSLGSLFQAMAPAIIRPQDELRRDRELYQRAIDEHSEQEATRLQRLIERHEMDVAEQQLRLEEARQRAREDQLQRDAAKLRARELLFEHMTSQQRETFDANGWFVVEGGKSKTRYRIRADESLVGNVDVLQLNGNGISHRLCAHVRHGTVPFGDQLLAQKVMLELAEDDFLRVANRHAAR